MCGIVGMFHADSGAGRVARAVLVAMRDTLVHRGPDDQGIWVSPDQRAGLGHRRLAIVDLAPEAAQPMTNEDGSVWISYNGEIYNHRALRAELLSRGHRFRTDHSDTEVIVHAYEEWGLDCVDRFQGMFAFGIVDVAQRRLFLARDRLGVKPLYLTFEPNLVLFASEIKALLANPAISAAVSPSALYHYFSFLTTPAPLTMFDGIYKLPAGCAMVIDATGAARAWRYWDALPVDSEASRELAGLSMTAQEDFCQRHVRTLLTQAVEKRMVSDVPFGVLLSGGLDSSTTVALMQQHMAEPVTTFTVGFSDHSYVNELDEARYVAEHFGTRHHEVLIDEGAARDYLPELIYHQDEPLADWVCIPLAFVSRLARESGTVVVQVGEGSDEQFCGYDHYLRYLALDRVGRSFSRLPSFVQRATAALSSAAADATGRGSFYADAVDRVAADRGVFWGGAIAFWERDKRRLLRTERFAAGRSEMPAALRPFAAPEADPPDTEAVIASAFAPLDRALPSADALARITYLECKLRLPELLLMRVDKITMSTSVEARVPFLDHALVEFMMGVPQAIKLKDGIPKALLKRAVRGLIPDRVIDRKKMGFATPMREWLRGDFGRSTYDTIMNSTFRDEQYLDYDEVERLFARHRAGIDMSLQIWAIYNVTAWFDRWVARDRVA